jgi:hypothetical protein
VPANTTRFQERAPTGREREPRRGDRRADGEQGARPLRRIANRLLYNEAKNLGIDGRSKMNKAQLQKAVDGHKS